MTTVLIVDDNAMDRKFAAALIKDAGMDTLLASDGDEALEIIERDKPDVVLSDLRMERMDGLELIERAKVSHPSIPIIIMTGKGSEEIAVEAMQRGAQNYVPKVRLATVLVSTINDVVRLAQAVHEQRAVMQSIVKMDTVFELSSTDTNVDALVGYFADLLGKMGLCNEADRIRVSTALHEALVNAREHGNLELDSDLREQGDGSYQRIAIERALIPPYCDRRVTVHAQLHRDTARFEIHDEGPGFDPRRIPDPTDPENLGKVSGRGLFLIQTFMDEVQFNNHGRSITMIKHRSGEQRTSA